MQARFKTLSELRNRARLPDGPVALIVAEDDVLLSETIAHHRDLGFAQVILCATPEVPEVEAPHLRLDWDGRQVDALPRIVNAAMPWLAGRWVYAGYNAEFLYYPFAESRSVSEMTTFNEQEHRDTVLCFAVDVYARDLDAAPDGVSVAEAYLDKSTYYAQARPDPDNHNYPKERQLDFNGGLRWRYWDHIPQQRRRIDRMALFRATKDTTLRADFTLEDEERNTYMAEWHNSMTAAVASFRTAKALVCNPGSAKEIDEFMWSGSVKFDWHAKQLLDLGLMEPGQWF